MAKHKKRANGRGTIYKRKDGKGYRGQQKINGVMKSYSAATITEIEKRMEADRVDALRGTYVAGNNITLKEWVEMWLLSKKEPYVKPQTYVKIRNLFDNHIVPSLGNYELQKLNKVLLEKAYLKLVRKADGSLYSESHMKQMSSLLNSCLEDAADEGLIARNPHNRINIPKGTLQKTIQPYTQEQQQLIVDYVKQSNKRADWMYLLIIATGMREGEAEALTWADVDFRNKTITINKTRLMDGTIQNTPKTQKSNRVISIPNNLLSFLNDVKENIDQEKNMKNLVIPNTKYNTYAPDYLRRRFEEVCAILGISYNNGLHSLRHTWATRALEKNIPIKVVSEMLGHENVQITMNVYQSVLRNTQEEAVAIMNDLF